MCAFTSSLFDGCTFVIRFHFISVLVDKVKLQDLLPSVKQELLGIDNINNAKGINDTMIFAQILKCEAKDEAGKTSPCPDIMVRAL